MNSLRNQLTLKALQRAQDQRKKKKKQKSKSTAEKLGKVLKEIVTGKASSKKKRKRRRRRLPDGTIESFSVSSSSAVDTDEEKSANESELEAPMKKKSRSQPGSVMNLLVSHVKEMLEQGAATSVGTSSNSW